MICVRRYFCDQLLGGADDAEADEHLFHRYSDVLLKPGYKFGNNAVMGQPRSGAIIGGWPYFADTPQDSRSSVPDTAQTSSRHLSCQKQ